MQRQVGKKKGKPWRVLKAAWHFVTVGVEQATEKENKSIKLDVQSTVPITMFYFYCISNDTGHSFGMRLV